MIIVSNGTQKWSRHKQEKILCTGLLDLHLMNFKKSAVIYCENWIEFIKYPKSRVP